MNTTLNEKQQFYKAHLENAQSSELSLSAYAKRHNLNTKALYNYKRTLIKKGVLSEPKAANTFAKVQVQSGPRTVSGEVVRVQLPNGVVVEYPHATPDLLTVLMSL